MPPKSLSTRLPSFGDSACLSAYKSKLLERTAADMRRHKLLRLLGMDRSRVVWAREPEKGDASDLLSYFRGRKVWLVEADTDPPRISPYAGSR